MCRQRNTLYSATLLYTYISRFSVNPHHQQREKIRQSYRHGSISSRFSTSPTNGPRSLLRAKVGTHSALLKGSHTRAHTAKQGAFQLGALLLPSERSARSQISPGRVSERRTLPLWDLGREVLSKNAESLRDSDALMRVAVPRRRGPAGPRDLFASAEVAACTPCAQCFPNVRDEGWYHYPQCALRAAETPDGRLSKRLICRFLRSGGHH